MNLVESFTKNKKRSIIARGEAGKGGKTAGRGHKGQKSRSGFNMPNGFEGGQSTFTTRTPKKRGGLHKKNLYLILNFAEISSKIDLNKDITPELLLSKNIIEKHDIGKIIKLSNINKNIIDGLKVKNIQLIKK